MNPTRASTYAWTAVKHMANQKDRSKPTPSHQVAKLCGIPERFLLKVLKPLVTAGVLRSIKGPNGGYALAKDRITACEIMEAVDGPIISRPNWEGKGDRRAREEWEKTFTNINEAIRKVARQTVVVRA